MSETRILSNLEESFFWRNELNLYNNFLIAVEYAQDLTLSDISYSLGKICNKYSQFCLQIYPTSSETKEGFEFKFLKSIKLNQVLETLDDESVTVSKLFSRYTDYKFKYSVPNPLWHLVLLNKRTLLFVAEHVVFDGTAGKLFHSKFLENLPTATTSKPSTLESTIFSLPTSLHIQASPIQLQSNFYPPPNYVSPKASTNPVFIPPISAELMSKSEPSTHYSTIIELTTEETKQLLNISRNHNIKLTSLLYAICTKSILKLPISHLANSEFRTMIPINTRSNTSSANDYPFGLFFGKFTDSRVVSHLLANIDNESFFWSNAKNFQDLLIEGIPKALYGFGLAEEGGHPKENMEALLKRNANPTTTIAISNIGVLDLGPNTDCWFDQPMVDASWGCHVLSSHSGLRVNLTSHRGINANIYQGYVSGFESIVDEILKNSL